jgi:hypothetical protein
VTADYSDPEQLARLRVATITGHLPPDLGRWAVARLAEGLPAREIQDTRNACLLQAARRLSGGPWARARRLAREVARARAVGPLAGAWPPNGTLAGEVAAALLIDPDLPTSPRHLLRVLTDSA